jgi:hypothetical protein
VNQYTIAIEAAVALLLLTVAVAVAVGWHMGGLGPRAELEAQHAAWAQTTAQALLAQRASAQAQAINDNAAETAHDQTIEALPARVVRTPVFLRAPGDLCPDRVPSPQAQTSGQHPASGGAESGRGGDLRPAIEALKVKYETALADCRRLDAEWPK